MLELFLQLLCLLMRGQTTGRLAAKLPSFRRAPVGIGRRFQWGDAHMTMVCRIFGLLRRRTEYQPAFEPSRQYFSANRYSDDRPWSELLAYVDPRIHNRSVIFIR